MNWLGVLALACYAIHGGYHLLHRHPEHLLWGCHVGAATVGVGLLCGSANTNAVGVLFLMVGVPLWLLDISAGGEFVPTSALTHLGGLTIGLIGMRQLGMPKHVWWKAVLAMALLMLLSRLLTPPSANVNVAFAVKPGWEAWFPSHIVYVAGMFIVAAAAFFAAECGLRRWLG